MPLPGCRRPGALFGPLAPRLRLRTVPGRGLAPFPGGGPNGASPRPRRWPPPPPLARITCPSLLPSGVFAPGLVRRRSPRAAHSSGVDGAGERRRVRPGSHQGGKASRAACVGWWLPSCRRHPCPVGRRVRASLHQEWGSAEPWEPRDQAHTASHPPPAAPRASHHAGHHRLRSPRGPCARRARGHRPPRELPRVAADEQQVSSGGARGERDPCSGVSSPALGRPRPPFRGAFCQPRPLPVLA